MVKRVGESPKRRGKKARTVNLVPVVVDALVDSEALSTDLRTLLKATLPFILEENKVDRHAYENEVVAEAESAFATVLAAMEANHATALEKQNEVISPEEHAKRTKAKQDAEAALEALVKKVDSSKEAQASCRKALKDGEANLKAVQKEGNVADKEMQALNNKKTHLSDFLSNDFLPLQQETSNTPAGKKAMKKLEAIGKEYALDDTLLATFPLTCKKDPANRSEFETMMFTSLKTTIDQKIDGLTQKVAALEPSKAEKAAAVTAAEQSVEALQASLATATEEHSSVQAAYKEADKAVAKADDWLYKIWGHMKEACDAQDNLADGIKTFRETMQSFEQLRDREPEPDPVDEPEAEEAAPEASPEASPDAAAEAAPEASPEA